MVARYGCCHGGDKRKHYCSYVQAILGYDGKKNNRRKETVRIRQNNL